MLTLAALALLLGQPEPPLSKLDQARGYTSLSGPAATSLWRGYKQPSFPSKGWHFENGVLSSTHGASAGDLITANQHGDFEITLQYKTAPRANSGIIYRCTEGLDASYMTGPEFQIYDDIGNNLKLTDPHSAGALYDIAAPPEAKVEKPAGEWNEARIYLRNGQLQHWLNGVKLVDLTIADFDGKPTQSWLSKIAASKFKEWKGFGIQPTGHIALQDHGDE